VQAQAILDLRLQRLTGLEQDKIVGEYGEVMARIADLLDILDKPERVTEIIAPNWPRSRPPSVTSVAPRSSSTAQEMSWKT
jgi:DNA gyrase/topoisomerase IV subunit A